MAPASRAAVETNRWCDWIGVPSQVGAAVSLWALYCWQAIVFARLARVSPMGAVGASGRACLSFVALSLLTAGLLTIAGASRATFLQRLFPEPVRVGFLAGGGITVAVAESADLALNGPGPLAVGAGSIALLLGLRRLGLGASAPLPVLALALAASAAFDLERRGVGVVGGDSVALTPAALTVLLDGRTLLPLMAAALSITVLASAPPSSAAEPRASPGARRAAAGAGVVSILSLALSNALGPLPLATVSAILVVVGIGWIDARRLSELRQASPRDFRMALVAAFGVTLFGLRWGVAIGVATALSGTLRHAMTTRLEALTLSASERSERRFDAPSLPAGHGVLMYRQRRRGYRWVRVPWPPRRRGPRRSGAARDDAADGAGSRSRPAR
jgi:MFS superfamily sulfate permease-like transporter